MRLQTQNPLLYGRGAVSDPSTHSIRIGVWPQWLSAALGTHDTGHLNTLLCATHNLGHPQVGWPREWAAADSALSMAHHDGDG